MNKDKLKEMNWWKWSFIILVTILLVLFLKIFFLIQPKSIHEENSENIQNIDKEAVLETSLKKADAEYLINHYIESISAEDSADFNIELTNELILKGNTDILKLTIPFTLSFDPYVLENGNIQLKVKELNVSEFSLPVNLVMSLIVSSLDIPDFISVNTKEQLVIIHFDKIEDSEFSIEFEKIDLSEDIIKMNLHINDEIFID